MLNGEESELTFLNISNPKVGRRRQNTFYCTHERTLYKTIFAIALKVFTFFSIHWNFQQRCTNSFQIIFIINYIWLQEIDKTNPPDAFVILYSVVDKASFLKAEAEMTRLHDADLLRSRPVILVGNKVDLARSRAVSTQGIIYIIISNFKWRSFLPSK